MPDTADLAAEDDSDTADRPGADGLALLDALPLLRLTLHDAPEQLQLQLYELTQLTVRVHHETEEITILVRLPADRVGALTGIANAATAAPGFGSPSRLRDHAGARRLGRSPGTRPRCQPRPAGTWGSGGSPPGQTSRPSAKPAEGRASTPSQLVPRARLVQHPHGRVSAANSS